MTSRRTVLAAGTLGLATLSSGCLDMLIGNEDPSQASDGSGTDLDETLRTRRRNRTELNREFQFGYGRETFEPSDSELINRLIAVSESSSGDQLRLDVPDQDTNDVVTALLVVWNVVPKTSVVTTIDGTSVRFRGGSGPNYAFLAGAMDTAVVATRGKDLAAAKSRAKTYSLAGGDADPE